MESPKENPQSHRISVPGLISPHFGQFINYKQGGPTVRQLTQHYYTPKCHFAHTSSIVTRRPTNGEGAGWAQD